MSEPHASTDTAVQPRRSGRPARPKSLLAEAGKIIAGGATGIALAIILLQTVLDKDPLGLFAEQPPQQRVAQQQRAPRSTTEPDAPREPPATENARAATSPQAAGRQEPEAVSGRQPATPAVAPSSAPPTTTTLGPAAPWRTGIAAEPPGTAPSAVSEAGNDTSDSTPAASEPAASDAAASEALATEAGRSEPLAVPSPQAQQKVLAEIRDIYAQRYAAARSDVQHAELGRFLLQQATTLTADPVPYFVILREAYEHALDGGDLDTARSAADALIQQYRVGAARVRVDTIERIVGTRRSAESAREAAEVARQYIDEAMRERQYAEAERLAQLLEGLALKARDGALRRDAVERQATARRLQQKRSTVEEAIATLEDDPDAPAANAIYGRYLCLVEGDWDKGLEHLARGDEPVLQRAAKLDRDAPRDAEQQLQLAEKWRQIAESVPENQGFYARASRWYASAQPQLTGLSQLKAQQRLKEIDQLDLPAHLFPSEPPDPSVLAAGDTPAAEASALRTSTRGTASPGPARSPQRVAQGPAPGAMPPQAALGPFDRSRPLPPSGGDFASYARTIRLEHLPQPFVAKPSRVRIADHQPRFEVTVGQRREIKLPPGATSDSFKFSADGSKLLVAERGDIVFRNSVTLDEQQRLEAHDDKATVAVSADGSVFATSGEQGELKVWDARSRQQRFVFRGHAGKATLLALSSDGSLLATASMGDLKLWDLRNSRYLGELANRANLTSLTFSPDGTTLAAGGSEDDVGVLLTWDTRSGRGKGKIRAHSSITGAVAFSPSGHLLVSGNFPNDPDAAAEVRVWDPAAGALLKELGGVNGLVRDIAFSGDGRLLVVGSRRNLRMWDTETLRPVGEIAGETRFERMALSGDGRRVANMRGYTGPLTVWDLEFRPAAQTPAKPPQKTAQASPPPPADRPQVVRISDNPSLLRRQFSVPAHATPVNAVAVSASLIASGGADARIHLWQLDSGQHVRTLDGHGLDIQSVNFSGNGSRLLSASGDGDTRVWDVAPGSMLHRMRAGSDFTPVRAIFSPQDPDVAYTLFGTGWLRCFDAPQGTVRWEAEHPGSAYGLAISPAGGTLAVSADEVVSLWTTEGEERFSIQRPAGQLRAIVFTPNGDLLAYHQGELLILYDIENQQVVDSFRVGAAVDFVAFHPSQPLLVAGGAGLAGLYHWGTGELLVQLEGYSLCAVFSPTGQSLIVGYSNGQFDVFAVDPTQLAASGGR